MCMDLITFKLKSIIPNKKVVVPKELQEKIGQEFAIEPVTNYGSKQMFIFEDGYEFETSPLEVEGIKKDKNDSSKVTMITKEMMFELEYLRDKKLKIKLEEQLSF